MVSDSGTSSIITFRLPCVVLNEEKENDFYVIQSIMSKEMNIFPEPCWYRSSSTENY